MYLPKRSALVHKTEYETFQIQNLIGDIRPLPFRYDELSPISDPYDSTKDFIGYVDLMQGVVIVDAATLIDEYNRGQNAVGESPSSDDISNEGGLQRSARNSSLEVVLSDNLGGDGSRTLEHSIEDQKTREMGFRKTMHQLAYEKKNNGCPLPKDSERPISGFAIKQGELAFNSTTFNAFKDEFHTSGRDMGDVERTELLVLLDKLKREEHV